MIILKQGYKYSSGSTVSKLRYKLLVEQQFRMLYKPSVEAAFSKLGYKAKSGKTVLRVGYKPSSATVLKMGYKPRGGAAVLNES